MASIGRTLLQDHDPSVAQINTDMPSLPALDNPLSFRVRGICAHLQATRQLQLKLRVAIQRDKTEVFFRRMLKEDKGAGQWEGTNYVDFLCQIHRDIKELLN
ncbi:Protein transport protein Sec24D [Geodia barretti]|uniref:Protein transport protein Sec24D n=1 Tax=Geodia barretti TaxID=519541 RepID=A0AA35S3Y2_GEOBA|nr:Protein transport protein Sec24D [Geodia barretti]